MPESRRPGPLDGYGDRISIKDGTLNRQTSPLRRSTGRGTPSTGKPKKVKVLALDGAKVHNLLYHAALAEVQWRDLNTDPHADPQQSVQKHKALDLAAKLYHRFLSAAAQGPHSATAFLAEQHDRTKRFLQQSQAILQGLQVENAAHMKLLSEIAFGAQLVKSGATVGVAGISCFLAAPVALVGLGISVGFTLTLEFVDRFDSNRETKADTVVVGFKKGSEALASAADLSGDLAKSHLDAIAKIKELTLNYPLKSSTYRNAVASSARLEILGKALGVVGALATLYTEFVAPGNRVDIARDEMQKESDYYDSLLNPRTPLP